MQNKKTAAQTEQVHDTATALTQAAQNLALEQSKLAQCEATFEARQDADSFSKIVDARNGVEMHTRRHGFALAAHEKHEAEQAAIARATQERVRLAALAKNTAAREECFRVARDAGKTLIEQLAASWALTIEAQGISGNAAQNDLAWELNSVFPQIAAEHGLSLRAVVIS